MPDNLKWKCRRCGNTLGNLDKMGEELSIKIRDQYLWIEGGSVTRTCGKCGALNRLDQRTPEQQLKIIEGGVRSNGV